MKAGPAQFCHASLAACAIAPLRKCVDWRAGALLNPRRGPGVASPRQALRTRRAVLRPRCGSGANLLDRYPMLCSRRAERLRWRLNSAPAPLKLGERRCATRIVSKRTVTKVSGRFGNWNQRSGPSSTRNGQGVGDLDGGRRPRKRAGQKRASASRSPPRVGGSHRVMRLHPSARSIQANICPPVQEAAKTCAAVVVYGHGARVQTSGSPRRQV